MLRDWVIFRIVLNNSSGISSDQSVAAELQFEIINLPGTESQRTSRNFLLNAGKMPERMHHP